MRLSHPCAAQVETPEDVRRLVERASKKLDAMDEAVATSAQEVEDATRALDRLAAAKVDVADAADAVATVDGDLEAHKQTLKELRASEATHASLADDLTQLHKCLKTADANAASVDDRLDYLVRHSRAKGDASRATLAHLQDQLRNIDDSREHRRDMRRKLDAAEQAFAAEIAIQQDAEREQDFWIEQAALNVEHLVRATTIRPSPIRAA